MTPRKVLYATLLYLVWALSIAPAAYAAPMPEGGNPPPLPPNVVTEAAKCDTEAEVCVMVFQSAPGKSADVALAASPTTNQYVCGVDVYHYGAWSGRLQQNVYGSYGWGQYGNKWKLDSGNLSTSAAAGQWWASLNGPNPEVPWGTLAMYEHVRSSAWLFPWTEMHWVDAYFDPFGDYSCSGG